MRVTLLTVLGLLVAALCLVAASQAPEPAFVEVATELSYTSDPATPAAPTAAASVTSTATVSKSAATKSSGTGTVQNFCEVCILMMQLKHNNKPQLCKGLAAEHWITCVEILESMLRADKAMIYWEKNGCLHMDANGPQIVKPCPALPVCSWIPNLFANPPSVVRDGVEALCPKDSKYMPVIPPNFQAVAIDTPPTMPANN
jgi:hypothetical protein